MAEAEREARGKANQAREEYITYAVETRQLADKIEQQYKLLAGDKEVQEAIEELNKATGKTFALARIEGHARQPETLKKVEDTVLSDEIPLRSENGTLMVHAVINGNKCQGNVSRLGLEPDLAAGKAGQGLECGHSQRRAERSSSSWPMGALSRAS